MLVLGAYGTCRFAGDPNYFFYSIAQVEVRLVPQQSPTGSAKNSGVSRRQDSEDNLAPPELGARC